jgi:hypothetical protein
MPCRGEGIPAVRPLQNKPVDAIARASSHAALAVPDRCTAAPCVPAISKYRPDTVMLMRNDNSSCHFGRKKSDAERALSYEHVRVSRLKLDNFARPV